VKIEAARNWYLMGDSRIRVLDSAPHKCRLRQKFLGMRDEKHLAARVVTAPVFDDCNKSRTALAG
jgi:hypothetical protein